MSLDELDEPLRDTTFTVVDLETTGGRAGNDGITEIGAVKVRGGEVIGEFQTLVDPGVGITPFVSVLTGITDAMVCGAPAVAVVLPSFLEFAAGSVLVAHNAPFDVGFLRMACQERGLRWPGFAVVDTAILARRVLTRDEVSGLPAGHAGHVLPRHDPAGTSRAGRRTRHRRRPARAAGPARQPRRPVLA